MAVAQLRVLGGAMARVPAAATAFAHRRRPMMAGVGCVYEDAADRPVHDAWADRFAAALRQGDPGVYVNFLSDEGPERVREAYLGPTWDRLVEVKRRYDPGNLFHRNQNIPRGLPEWLTGRRRCFERLRNGTDIEDLTHPAIVRNVPIGGHRWANGQATPASPSSTRRGGPGAGWPAGIIWDEGFARVSDLADRFGVSAVTVRADLTALEARAWGAPGSGAAPCPLGPARGSGPSRIVAVARPLQKASIGVYAAP